MTGNLNVVRLAVRESYSQIRDLARGFGQRDSLAQSVLWLYVVQASTYLLPVISLTYLARILSVETFGLIAYAQAFAGNFALLTEYGFNMTATREVAAHRDDPAALSRIFSGVMAAKVFLLCVSLIIFTLSLFINDRLAAHKPVLLVSFTITLGYLLFPIWLFQGLQLMKQVAFRDLLAKGLVILILVLLVHGDGDVLWAVFAPAAGLILSGIMGLLNVRRLTAVRFTMPPIDEVRRQLAVGWPMFIGSAVGPIMLSMGILVVGAQSMEEVGYFNVAFRVAVVARMVNGPLSTVLFSHLSHKAASSEAEAREFVRKYARLLSLPFFIVSVLLAVTIPWMIPVIFGPRYAMAILPMAVLSFTVFTQAWSAVYSTYFMLPCGYDRQWLWIIGCMTVASMLALIYWRGSYYWVFGDLSVALACRQFYRMRARRAAAAGELSPAIEAQSQ